MGRHCRYFAVTLLAVVAAASATSVTGAAMAGEAVELFGGSFNGTYLLQGSLQGNSVADSQLNPGNLLARLPQRTTALEARPDFHFASDALDLRFSPRGQWQQNTLAAADATSHATSHATTRDNVSNVYVGGWTVRVNPSDTLALSGGRAVLLWGPAQSESPSNPFYTDNGRDNPYLESAGKDFYKVAWFPAPSVTLNYIDNVGNGRGVLPPWQRFHRTRVVKLDYTGRQLYWEASYAAIEGQAARLGASMQATVSDALVLYAEGGYSRARSQYRPQIDASGNWQLAPPDTRRGLYGLTVAGGAYTLQAGPTITVEYLYNNQGWSLTEAAATSALTQAAAARFTEGGAGDATAADAALLLAHAGQPGSALQRKHYLFVQYLHRDLAKNLDLTVRALGNLDDHSTRVGTILEWRLDQRFKLIALGVNASGGSRKEFGAYVARQWFLGLDVSL